MNPKAIKVSMTTEEREYLVKLLVAHRLDVLNTVDKTKSDKAKNAYYDYITTVTTLINKINK